MRQFKINMLLAGFFGIIAGNLCHLGHPGYAALTFAGFMATVTNGLLPDKEA
jgi:hypothetical protein